MITITIEQWQITLMVIYNIIMPLCFLYVYFVAHNNKRKYEVALKVFNETHNTLKIAYEYIRTENIKLSNNNTNKTKKT
jgi:hypothetical protein